MEFKLVVDLSPATRDFLASLGLTQAKAVRMAPTVAPLAIAQPVVPFGSVSKTTTAELHDDTDAVAAKRRGRPTKAEAAAKAALAPVAAPAPAKGKAKPVAEEDEDDEADESDDDVGEEDDIDDEEPEEEDEVEADDGDKISPDQLKKLKSALKAYSETHSSKEKALKLLYKFAKVSQDVKAADFPKLMKALKV